MGISSPGLGSNLDVNGIVTKLMAVEQQPITQLDLRTASFKAKLTGFGTLKSVISQFQTALQGLANNSKFQGSLTSVGDTTVATASASTSAAPGTYSLEVSQLAQAQKLNAVGQVSDTAAIGSGATTTLSFDFGTISGGAYNSAAGSYSGAKFTSSGTGAKTVTLDSSNNSLSGIRDAINAAGVGVTASIVNDGSGTPYRLSLAGNAPGISSSLKLSVTGDAALSNLLSHDPGKDAGQALSQTQVAQNALFKVDGISVSKSSNSVTDAIPGLTLALAKTNVGAPTSITVSRNTSTIVASVNAFVQTFNNTSANLQNATAYDATTKTGAVLNGESTVLSIQNQIRGVLSKPVAGGGSAYTLLSQIGVTIQKDGTLGVDNTKLQAALTSNFGDFAGLFSAVGRSSDALVAYGGSSAKTVPGSYAVNITNLATQGRTTAASAAPLTITSGVNDAINVTLNGVATSITLTAGTYATADLLASEVQSKINGAPAFSAIGANATVTQSSGVLAINSASYGASSAVTVSAGSGQTNDLGFGSGTTTVGKNVAGTINGKVATGLGQTLTGATGDATEGLSILINGGTTGNRGTVNYTQGYAYQLNKLATGILASDGSIASRTNGLNASISDIAKTKVTISTRLVTTEARYRAQFTALDGVISSMSTTSSFLTQQLANLSKNA